MMEGGLGVALLLISLIFLSYLPCHSFCITSCVRVSAGSRGISRHTALVWLDGNRCCVDRVVPCMSSQLMCREVSYYLLIDIFSQ